MDSREILTGILFFVLKTGIAWDDLPADLGRRAAARPAGPTCRRGSRPVSGASRTPSCWPRSTVLTRSTGSGR